MRWNAPDPNVRCTPGLPRPGSSGYPPRFAGRAGWGGPEAYFLLARLHFGTLDLPTLALPMNGEGRNCPPRFIWIPSPRGSFGRGGLAPLAPYPLTAAETPPPTK